MIRHITWVGYYLDEIYLFQQGLSLMAKRQIEAHGDTEAMKTYQSGPNRQRS